MAIEKLTALFVKRKNLKKGRYSDGGNLYLYVRPNRAGTAMLRNWVIRYRLPGRKPREMGLGDAEIVDLSAARRKAEVARRQIYAGIDPLDAKQAAQQDAAAQRSTFQKIAEEYIEGHQAAWKNEKHRAQWRSTLKMYVYPLIGDDLVAQVDIDAVKKVLDPIWTTKPETASRVRGRIESVLAYAHALKLRSSENPAAWRQSLKPLFPATSKVKRVKHHKSLPWKECPNFASKLVSQEGTAALALQLTILTTCRTSEVLEAPWDEFDLDEKIWTIPAERMKAQKEHRVPLTASAIRLLQAIRSSPIGQDRYVFPAEKTDRPMSNMSMSSVLKRMEVTHATVHGFRASFRTWAAESDGRYRHDIAEAALAHIIGDETVAAYQRGDYFELRTAMMMAWDDFLSFPPPKVPLGYQRRHFGRLKRSAVNVSANDV